MFEIRFSSGGAPTVALRDLRPRKIEPSDPTNLPARHDPTHVFDLFEPIRLDGAAQLFGKIRHGEAEWSGIREKKAPFRYRLTVGRLPATTL